MFQVRVTVRGYELDSLGHLNQAVYLQYAEHARWEILRAAGLEQATLLDSGVAPVVLETTIKYRRELRAGDEVDVSCEFRWGEGRTFGMHQEIRRTDGTLAAELDGMLDLGARKLLPDPVEAWRKVTPRPAVLGL
ncbi:acyl-CoA thioesterase [Asanoa siamensis]|uniref:Thioesterase n=1 Tax=Asanoa siamensis TaxID=926357 RepID=A0ABQ4CKY0_9ACTN|nr:acyl-CoA thioesterase [Asanoa siamensis]GIF71940.1 thioesterase [Asanoa siamensis]